MRRSRDFSLRIIVLVAVRRLQLYTYIKYYHKHHLRMKRSRSPTVQPNTDEPLATAQALIRDNEGSADKALLAACKGDVGVFVVTCLVKELGANAAASYVNGWTPLHFAASGGFCAVVRALVGELGSPPTSARSRR